MTQSHSHSDSSKSQKSGSQGKEDKLPRKPAAGISNRPPAEEADRQEKVPPRGRDKE